MGNLKEKYMRNLSEQTVNIPRDRTLRVRIFEGRGERGEEKMETSLLSEV